MILIDGRTIQDHFPGIGRYTYHLASALARVVPDRTLGVLHNPNQPNTRYDLAVLAGQPNVELLSTNVPSFTLAEQWRLSAQIRELRPEVYHSPYYIMPYLTSVPTLVTVYDFIPLIWRQYFSAVQQTGRAYD